MLTIGFTTVYYTLWDVNSWQESRVRNGETHWYLKTSHQYLRNLSMDLEAAKAKVMALGPNTQYDIALGLHGTKWFETEKSIPQPVRDYTFSFGRLKSLDIRTIGAAGDETWEWHQRQILTAPERDAASVKENEYYGRICHTTDEYQIRATLELAKYMKDIAWQLDRAYRMESTVRRRIYARRRLIELGELVRRDWFEKIPVYSSGIDVNGDAFVDDHLEPIAYKEVRRKWLPKALANWKDTIGDKRGLYYEDGKRLEFTLQQVGKTKKYPSDYGTLYIVNFNDQNGNLVTYKGGTPLKQPNGEGVQFKVLATIKHKNNQTFIQRIKAV